MSSVNCKVCKELSERGRVSVWDRTSRCNSQFIQAIRFDTSFVCCLHLPLLLQSFGGVRESSSTDRMGRDHMGSACAHTHIHRRRVYEHVHPIWVTRGSSGVCWKAEGRNHHSVVLQCTPEVSRRHDVVGSGLVVNLSRPDGVGFITHTCPICVLPAGLRKDYRKTTGCAQSRKHRESASSWRVVHEAFRCPNVLRSSFCDCRAGGHVSTANSRNSGRTTEPLNHRQAELTKFAFNQKENKNKKVKNKTI